nr:hypothetical protein [Thiorhodococcus minor]
MAHVLRHQHGEGRPPMLARQFAALAQRPHDDGRRGHGEGQAGDSRGFPWRLQHQDHVRGKHSRGQQHLRGAQTEDQAAHLPDLLGPHLQTDAEHEQDHAELGDALQLIDRMHGDRAPRMRPDEHTGDDEAQDRTEAESLEQDDAGRRRGKKDDDREKDCRDVHGDSGSGKVRLISVFPD